MDVATQNLFETTMAFYGDCLRAYPELLTHPALNAIEAAMKRPDVEAEENPAYRLIVFLSEYKNCAEMPSYEAVYGAFEALTAPSERR